jgi:hypothetical protein
LEGREEGLKAAKTPLIAQYAPNTPKTTVKIAVVLMRKPAKSAFTVPALAGSHRVNRAAANDLLYPHLTPAAVNK